ncbi:MAG: EamA family transporter, partial [Candidatus Nanopelagicales bacterium]
MNIAGANTPTLKNPGPESADPSATRRTGLGLALVTAGISGVAVYLNSSGVRAFGDATAYTTAKNLVAAFVLLGIVAAAPATGAQLTRPTRTGQWLGLALVGVLGGAVAFALFFEGLARASSVQAAFLHKTLVVWVAVLAVLVLRERLGLAHWAAIGLLLVGQAGLAGGLLTGWGVGESMILAATLLWAVEVVVAKRLLVGLSSWTVACARMGVGSGVLVGWLVVRGDAGALVGMSAAQWGWVLLTGVLLAGYVSTWFAALARAGAVDVTAVLVLGALVTAVLAAGIDGVALAPKLGWLTILLAGGVLA